VQRRSVIVDPARALGGQQAVRGCRAKYWRAR
jgi:hypothetical protein